MSPSPILTGELDPAFCAALRDSRGLHSPEKLKEAPIKKRGSVITADSTQLTQVEVAAAQL